MDAARNAVIENIIKESNILKNVLDDELDFK
jgi:hypothetical protein